MNPSADKTPDHDHNQRGKHRRGRPGHRTLVGLDSWHNVLLRDTTGTWLQLLPAALRRTLRPTQCDNGGVPEEGFPSHEADMILQFIEQHNKHEVEELMKRQSADSREILHNCAVNFSTLDHTGFIQKTRDDDHDDMLWALTHSPEPGHDDDHDEQQQDPTDEANVRLRRLLKTTNDREREDRYHDWDMQEQERSSQHHIAKRTTWQGGAFGNLRQHCRGYIGLGFRSTRRFEAV